MTRQPGTIPSIILVEKYDLRHSLGEGTYACVNAATNIETNEEVAIKQIYVQKGFVEEAQQEITKLNIFKNDHIVKILDFFYDSTEFYLNVVLELCKGSLRGQLDNKQVYTEEELVSFIVQITSAFLELRDKKVMHLDFKPENVLIADKDGKHYKICDFGCSQIANISKISGYESNVFGTFNYLSPEVYLNYQGQKTSSCADIWAFGITLYEMVFGKLPFTNANDKNVDRKLAENYFYKKGYQIKYEIDDEDTMFKVIKLIKKMLTPLPTDRINWAGLKKELMAEFKVPEHLFININDAILNFAPVAEVFLAVTKMIREN